MCFQQQLTPAPVLCRVLCGRLTLPGLQLSRQHVQYRFPHAGLLPRWTRTLPRCLRARGGLLPPDRRPGERRTAAAAAEVSLGSQLSISRHTLPSCSTYPKVSLFLTALSSPCVCLELGSGSGVVSAFLASVLGPSAVYM